jgi:hypothetical protein
MEISIKPKIVDHGNVFGTTHWYLFYCPKCNLELNNNMLQKNEGKCDCGQLIDIKY